MSTATLAKQFRVANTLSDMTSVALSNSGGTYGVRRQDTGALVVADGTAMTHDGTGLYSYTWTEPAYGLVYEYSIEYVYGGVTYYILGTLTGTPTPTVGSSQDTVLASTMLMHLWASLKDPSATNYTEAELIHYINMGVRAVMRRIAATAPNFWMRTSLGQETTIDIVSGQVAYALPTDVFHIIGLFANATGRRLDCLSPDEAVLGKREGYMLCAGDIVLMPTPAANVTGGLGLFYVSTPPDVTASTEYVPLSGEFQDAIEFFVLILAKVRQEEQAEGFTAFYQMVQDTLDAHMTRVNAAASGSPGVRIPKRRFV